MAAFVTAASLGGATVKDDVPERGALAWEAWEVLPLAPGSRGGAGTYSVAFAAGSLGMSLGESPEAERAGSRVFVLDTTPAGQAHALGVHPGDAILAVAGDGSFLNVHEAVDAIRQTPRPVTLTLGRRRDGMAICTRCRGWSALPAPPPLTLDRYDLRRHELLAASASPKLHALAFARSVFHDMRREQREQRERAESGAESGIENGAEGSAEGSAGGSISSSRRDLASGSSSGPATATDGDDCVTRVDMRTYFESHPIERAHINSPDFTWETFFISMGAPARRGGGRHVS